MLIEGIKRNSSGIPVRKRKARIQYRAGLFHQGIEIGVAKT
ncbi:hypothetical protein LEP1GSC050_2202 [Leptospira broomii serovar Hurstbridge str. 5399]|uniref:Uncharacterized protein n=1 Tax=Leptospira broomii serovar Hurstbridge str. 5399 TaxID=1049789 RepID=T0EZT2_9LEPT|nr:hypothetical protein LEP1GSC050_2202 [Leptospira broomii serovar Hurstbridge str. 5399]